MKHDLNDMFNNMKKPIESNFNWQSNEDLNKVKTVMNWLEEYNENPEKFLKPYKE